MIEVKKKTVIDVLCNLISEISIFDEFLSYRLLLQKKIVIVFIASMNFVQYDLGDLNTV